MKETKAERNRELRKLLDDNPYMYPQIRDDVYDLLDDSEALISREIVVSTTDAHTILWRDYAIADLRRDNAELRAALEIENDEEIMRLRQIIKEEAEEHEDQAAAWGEDGDGNLNSIYHATIAKNLRAALAPPAESKERE